MPSRAHSSNTMLLPRITGGLRLEPETDLQPIKEEVAEGEHEPTACQDGDENHAEAVADLLLEQTRLKEDGEGGVEEVGLEDLTDKEVEEPEGWCHQVLTEETTYFFSIM